MEFVFETKYDQKALTAMAHTLRLTLRKKRSRRSHLFGFILVVICLIIVIPGGEDYSFDMRKAITAVVALVLLLVLIFEDWLNGYTARKRMLPGTEKSVAVFNEDGYTSEVGVGKSEWSYEKMQLVAETKDYFVFVFSQSHAQVYDKAHLTGGTVEGFREFIARKTGKTVEYIK